MRFLLPIAALLALATACEGTDDPPAGTPVPTNSPSPWGVQVGSEGLLPGCDTEDVGPDGRVDGFDLSPGELADALLGTFAITLDGGLTGELTLEAAAFRATTGDCDPRTVLVLEGELDLGDALSARVAGGAAIAPSEAGDLLIGADAWAGDRAPAFDPNAVDTAVVRTDAARIDADGAVGALIFEGCTGSDCQVDALGDFTALRP